MMKTVDFIDALRVAYSLTSDYQVAKKLGILPSAVSNWRAGREFFGEKMATAVAKMLELDPAYVYACSQIERSKSEEQASIWQRIYDKFRPSPTEEKHLKKRWPGCILCSIPGA